MPKGRAKYNHHTFRATPDNDKALKQLKKRGQKSAYINAALDAQRKTSK